MWRLIKKYLISHEGNDHKPHLLRETGLTFLFVLIISSFGLATLGRFVTSDRLTSLVLSSVLVDYANQDRSAQNYHHLAVNSVLEKAAQMKANDMAEKSYFAHTSPEGKNPWYWFKQAGYSFNYAGENLAVNFSDSKDVNTAWMNSPGHRANILNDKFTEIGIAIAEGMYQGKKTIFVVQLFGTPKQVVTTKVVEPTKAVVVSKPVQPKVVAEAKVLAETTENTGGTDNELFIAVENTDKTPIVKNDSNISYSNFFERIMSSPKKSLSILYSIISTIILFSLLSILFVEIKKDHKKMILLAVSLIVIMFGFLYLYQSVILEPLLIA